MKISIAPGPRAGAVKIPASKSQAHRLLILSALGSSPCTLICDGLSEDIKATIACLNALGAGIRETSSGRLLVTPIKEKPLGLRRLPCRESGSTLRFLLPLCAALGAEAEFLMEGRLPQRPLAPLDRELRSHGVSLRQEGDRLLVSGQLRPGSFSLPGDVSSQYISGLLMALPLLPGDSRLEICGEIESAGYISMSLGALKIAGMSPKAEQDGHLYLIKGSQRSRLPRELEVEGDWSNAAFFLSMGALSPRGIDVLGISDSSQQGDRAIISLLRAFGAHVSPIPGGYHVEKCALHGIKIDARAIPDLIPVLSVVAALAHGETLVTGAARLRLKESDRLKSSAALLTALGARVEELEDGLLIQGREQLSGSEVSAFGDHRIAMAAAVSACACCSPVILEGAQAVEKSYPRFWRDYEALEVCQP